MGKATAQISTQQLKQLRFFCLVSWIQGRDRTEKPLTLNLTNTLQVYGVINYLQDALKTLLVTFKIIKSFHCMHLCFTTCITH